MNGFLLSFVLLRHADRFAVFCTCCRNRDATGGGVSFDGIARVVCRTVGE